MIEFAAALRDVQRVIQRIETAALSPEEKAALYLAGIDLLRQGYDEVAQEVARGHG